MTYKSIPLSVATMTREQLDTELKKGYASIKAGKCILQMKLINYLKKNLT